MEVDKKILTKLLKVLEELKVSLKESNSLEVNNNDETTDDIDEGFVIKNKKRRYFDDC